MRTKDGTQFTFAPVTINNEYRCVQIKDRNGNYITATYNTTNGHLQKITDTLGREIDFVYNVDNNLERIRQSWAGGAHDWATFTYGSVLVAPNFGSGLLLNGPNNNYVTVLTQVSLHDGTYFKFHYNASFGQVNKIEHYAADDHLLEYTSYNVSASSGQTECPRFTERRDWAENWNNNTERVTGYDVAADGSWSQQTNPDGTMYKEAFHTSSWQVGLPNQTEVWSSGVRRKATTISWTQDDTNLSYQKNPRVTETNVYDEAGNRKRTTIDYYPTSSFSLPSDIYEYAADATTVLRRTHTDYNLNSVYTDRRIIGLVFGQYVYDGSGGLQSKVFYHRDWGDPWLVNQGAATQHDAANYGASFVAGRGNLVLIERYDVQYPNDASRLVSQKIGYNTTGSVIFTGDASWHRTDISYADSFSDGVNHGSFAYPTSITDADSNTSTAKYNYDFGAVTRTEDPKGAVHTITYDAAARVDRITNATNNGYTRHVYTLSGEVVTHSTIKDAGTEAFSATLFDGAGRVRLTGGNLPGSSGLFRALEVVYNEMGRVWKQTNPAETNSAWQPTGDDALGWVWTSQTYDWQGRPILTTNPDGSTKEASYGNCSCAGGEVTTVRDERGRRRKFTKDVLGRLKQVDELNWDQSVYSTTSYTYNT